jgi:hypothetical protein
MTLFAQIATNLTLKESRSASSRAQNDAARPGVVSTGRAAASEG